jgi:hypothetical protein
MVPFVQADVGSATVTWFSGFSNATARHAVQVTNTTAQTLPEGTLSVFADGGFAGETVLPRLKPGMRRFLEVGDDPDTEMKVDRQTASEAPQRLVFREGALQEHVIRTTELVLDLIHHGNQARHVRVEVFAGSNTTIEGADRVDFDEDRGHPLAAFEIEPGGRIDDRKVVIVEGLARSTRFDAITADQLERLSTAASLPATERSHAKTALERLRVQLESAQTVERVKADITTAEQDIERLRGHLQAMSGEGDGENNPLVKRLLAAEDALEALRRGLEAATAELAARTAATREQLTALQPTLGSPPV